MSLLLVTLTQAQANRYIARLHRHHEPPVGDKYRVGAWAAHGLCGVLTAGRPVARALDCRRVMEITRVCTDGTRNACSFLYRAGRTIARNLGYCVALTYTLSAESGASLRADGWWGEEEAVRGRSWDTPSRRRDGPDLGPKTRWVYLLSEWTPVVESEEASASAQLALLEVAP